MEESEKRIEMPKEIVALFERILNWTLPGLQFYYRDSRADINVHETYPIGSIIRAGFFIDVTAQTQRPTTKLRYLIASAHAANLGAVMHDADMFRWHMYTLHLNSYFKVMDIYERDGVTQVFLLHIPFQSIPLLRSEQTFDFIQGVSRINLVDMARKSLDAKMEMGVFPQTSERALLDRMEQPVGLNSKGHHVPLDFMLSSGLNKVLGDIIRRAGNDLDPINYPKGFDDIPSA